MEGTYAHTCPFCEYNLMDKRFHERTRAAINFTFLLKGKERCAKITDYSKTGMRIAYSGEFLPVNTIIDAKVDKLKIKQQAKTVWTKETGRLKAATGFRFVEAAA